MNIYHIYKVANYLYKLPLVNVLSKILYYFQFLLFNSIVPPSAAIGKGTRFAYGGIGVVIHARAVIGEGCLIGQGITIGGKSRIYDVPIIGDNVYIGPGARIIGPIKIGNNVVIGANAVVVKNVKSNCVVAGVPAVVIKEDINASDYY